VRIAIPISHFHKHGGIQRHTYELIQRWKDRHEIHVFSYTWEPMEGVVFHRIPGNFLPEVVMVKEATKGRKKP